MLVSECWLSTENVQCTCAGGTLEATITVRAEGTILGCTTSPVIGSITLGDPLPDTDPEIALRIYYAQAGEEVFAVARRLCSPGADSCGESAGGGTCLSAAGTAVADPGHLSCKLNCTPFPDGTSCRTGEGLFVRTA